MAMFLGVWEKIYHLKQKGFHLGNHYILSSTTSLKFIIDVRVYSTHLVCESVYECLVCCCVQLSLCQWLISPSAKASRKSRHPPQQLYFKKFLQWLMKDIVVTVIKVGLLDSHAFNMQPISIVFCYPG